LEPDFNLYLDHMMIVCAEIKRVLKKTGSFWLNLGDSYGGSWQDYGSRNGGQRAKSTESWERKDSPRFYPPTARAKSKCLLGIPWRLVLRLIDEEGFILRNAICWVKPNRMPSSKKDALTQSYEFLFHLVKNIEPQYYWNEKTGLMADRKPKELKENIDWEWRECPKCQGTGRSEDKICPRCKGTGKIKYSFWHSLSYWYDLDAIREAYTKPLNRWGGNRTKPTDRSKGNEFAIQERIGREHRPDPAGKNPGDVWVIPTQPRKDLHFSTFPDALCIKPILATCPQEICTKCGKPRVRIIKPTEKYAKELGQSWHDHKNDMEIGQRKGSTTGKRFTADYQTIGWTDCSCNAGWSSGILLDPFAGRGTSLIMA